MGNAVAEATGPVLVLGAAGTGKTTLLAEAVASRVRDGLAPALVLALTRQAASELRDRVVRAAGRTTLAPRVMTIHAFCLGLVTRYRDPEDEVPALLTAPQQEYRIRELLAGGSRPWPEGYVEASGTRAFAAQVRAVLARARQLGLDPDDVSAAAERAGEPGWAAVGAFMAEYLDVLDAEQALDYAELVHRARLLLERPDVLFGVRSTFGALYVDEWCELDAAQLALVRALAPDGAPVVALADPDTAIYRFRGAHPRAAQVFGELFGGATVVTLGTAWRQGAAVLAARASVARRLGVPAVASPAVAAYRSPAPGEGLGDGRVEACTLGDEATQAAFIAGELRAAHLADGLPWASMAVLVRAGRRQLPALTRALTDAGIPVEVAGDEIGLASEPAVGPLLLGLAVAGRGGAPDADEAARLLTSGWGSFDAVGLRTAARLLRAADPGPGGRPGADLVAEALAGVRAVPEELTALAERRDLLARATARVRDLARPEEVLWELWSGTDWPQRLRATALGGGDSAPRAHHDLDAVVALFGLAAQSAAPGGEPGVAWFEAEVAQQQIPADSQRESAVGGRGVRVLTAHRAKGRHWPFVVVAGVQEGVWPDVRRRGSVLDAARLGSAGLGEPVATRDLVAAERRLFLLACTRSEGRLLVTAVEGTEGEEDRPSRFLTELGVPVRHVATLPARLHTLRALVADLRRVAQDAEASPGLRAAAATRLARLAASSDDDGRRLVPDADPSSWWGLRVPTALTAPPPEGPVVLSPSQLESVLTCPRRYFLSREARSDPPRSGATLLGSVIHAVAERAASGGFGAGDAARALDAVWADIPFPAAWLSASERAEADAAVERLLAWQTGHGHADVVGVEVPFRAEIEVDAVTVVLAGVVDRLERTASGALRVIDFKTGRTKPTVAEAGAMPQVGVYQLAIEAGGFETVAPGARASAGASLVYLRHDDSPGWPKEFRQPSLVERPHLDADDAEEAAYPTWVHHRVAQARRVLAEGRFDARPSQGCQWCAVRSSCPARSGQVV